MARIHRPRTFLTSCSNVRWCAVWLVLSISIQSFVFSAVPTKYPTKSISSEESSTTLIYSMTNDDNTSGPVADTTTQQPEEIIFITSTKRVEKDARQRQLKPVYYGTPSGRALFSPRMEYNEWTPVGRGDPLKNDPTYDYSPPVLDRVRYWDSGKDKSSDILLLGVSSKKSPTLTHRGNPKDNNYFKSPNNIPMRRNYYMQNLPTILMPPPMQSPVQTPIGETWPIRSLTPPDQSTAGGTTYISVKANNGPPHPNKLPYLHSILQKEITRPQPFSMKQQQQYPMTSSTTVLMPPPAPSVPSSPSPFSMHHSQSVFESHSTQTTPLVANSMSQQQMEMEQQQINQMAVMMGGGASGQSNYDVSIMGPTPLSMHALHSSQVQFVTERSMEPMTTTIPTTVRPSTMTTDSYFSHYNQPQQPIGGPMYLIIEGHSKVKTYGQGDEEGIHMPKIVPVVPTEDSVITRVGSEEPMVKHLHKKGPTIKEEKKSKVADLKEKKNEENKMGGLLSFIDSSLGDFLKAEEEDNSVLEFNVEKSVRH